MKWVDFKTSCGGRPWMWNYENIKWVIYSFNQAMYSYFQYLLYNWSFCCCGMMNRDCNIHIFCSYYVLGNMLNLSAIYLSSYSPYKLWIIVLVLSYEESNALQTWWFIYIYLYLSSEQIGKPGFSSRLSVFKAFHITPSQCDQGFIV